MSGRVPCPHCAERIMPAAKFCRFCRKPVKPQEEPAPSMFPPVDSKRLNVPAIVALPLAILAWPICGVFFFFVFHQLIQSLIVGAIVAGAAVGCGIAGVCLAARRTKKTGGLLMAIGSMVIGGLAFMSLMGTYVVAGAASERMPESMSALRQVLGTDRPTAQGMKCAQCGHEFEVSSLALIEQQVGTGLKVFGGVEDIDSLLDEAEAGSAQGYPCPECRSASSWPLLTCPQCQARFSARQVTSPGGSPTCPQCGTAIPLVTDDLLRQMGLGSALEPDP